MRNLYSHEEIVVYGTKMSALKYILENGIDNVKFFIDEKAVQNEFYDRPVFKLEDALEQLNNKHIIVATSPGVYSEIRSKLEINGLTEFEDFTYYEIYKKKIAVIYGNCHTEVIREALTLSKIFSAEYGFYPLKAICNMKNENTGDYNLSVFGMCDLFLHQSIRMDNCYGQEFASQNILKKLKPACRVVAIPNLYGLPKCFFPQESLDETILLKNGDGELINMFPYRDRYIDECYIKGENQENIIRILNDESLIDKKLITCLWQEFIDKVRKRELEWDVKMSDFIIHNYRDKQLFYNPNHPTNEVFKYIILHLENILSIKESTDISIYDNLIELDSFEIPIYHSVSKALSLNYNKKFLRVYSKGYRLNGRAMDLEEYVRQYILWNWSINNEERAK